MKSAALVAALLLLVVAFALAKEPKGDVPRIKEGAYYEFRGHMSDRDTIANTFTLGWDKGSQRIVVTPETKVFRHGKTATLGDAKAGDAARGFGRVLKGKLVAVAVAFGEEGVELPPTIKIPPSITVPPPQSSE